LNKSFKPSRGMSRKLKVFIFKEAQEVAALAMKAMVVKMSSKKLLLKYKYLEIRCLKYK